MRDLEEEGRVYTVGDTRGFLSRVGEGGREWVETMGGHESSCLSEPEAVGSGCTPGSWDVPLIVLGQSVQVYHLLTSQEGTEFLCPRTYSRPGLLRYSHRHIVNTLTGGGGIDEKRE